MFNHRIQMGIKYHPPKSIDVLLDMLQSHKVKIRWPEEEYGEGFSDIRRVKKTRSAKPDIDVLHEMLTSEHTICGLGDAGAHVATICDAGYPTFMLQHWGRDRTRGPKLSLEFLVAKQTRKTAQAFGLLDRGVLAPGYRADLNIIDPTAIRVTKPRLLHDLPANGKRLIQYAEGYLHTFVGGVETLDRKSVL